MLGDISKIFLIRSVNVNGPLPASLCKALVPFKGSPEGRTNNTFIAVPTPNVLTIETIAVESPVTSARKASLAGRKTHISNQAFY